MKLYKLKPLTSGGKPLPDDIVVGSHIEIDGPGSYQICHDRLWYQASHCWSEFASAESIDCNTFVEAVAWIEQDRIARVETLCDVVE